MDDRERFKGLPYLKTDNEIIDAILSALLQCRLNSGYPFEVHRDKFDLLTVSRIIGLMQSKGLVDVKSAEYGDKYDDKLILTERGSLIASSGGWLKHLEENMTESQQIDEILNGINAGKLFALHNDVTPLFRSAIHKSLGYRLIKPHGNTFKLDENGYEALEMGGFDKWRAFVKDTENKDLKTNKIIFNGPVSGSSVTQDSPFRDLKNSVKTTSAIPAENEKQQNAKVSIIEKWIVPIIITIASGVILLMIEHKTGWFSGH